MNYNLSLLIAFVFMLLAAAAERMSAYHVQALQARRNVLTEKLNSLDERFSRTAIETAKYKAVDDAVTEIESRITPEGDSTGIIEWFDTNAAKLGVILVNSRVVPPEHAAEAYAYQRIRMDVRLRGAYLGLLQCLESVERSSMPMLIDSFSLSSAREIPGTGELVLNVSCLFPMPEEKSPRTGGTQ